MVLALQEITMKLQILYSDREVPAVERPSISILNTMGQILNLNQAFLPDDSKKQALNV